MYKVTGIKKITNKRYLVEIDEYIRFPLYISELKRNGIEVDKVIETDKVEMIMKKTLLPRCRERVFYILKDSDKSEFDVRRKLADNFYPAEIIDIVINEMLEKGYLDDKRYAENYINSRIKTIGINRIKNELRQHGIDKEIIETFIIKTDESEMIQMENIRNYLEKKSFDYLNCDIKEKNRIISALVRKGFEFDMINKVIHEMK